MIRNIIWDMDGTIFDVFAAIAKTFQWALKDHGHDAPIERIMAAASDLGIVYQILSQRQMMGNNQCQRNP